MTGDGKLPDAVARWANLSLEERIADRVFAILFAADEIRDMVALAGQPSSASAFQRVAEQVHELVQPLLPCLTGLISFPVERDPEVEQILLKLDISFSRSEAIRELDRDTLWERLENEAAPYALAFYYEIRRLDRFRLLQTSLSCAEPDQQS